VDGQVRIVGAGGLRSITRQNHHCANGQKVKKAISSTLTGTRVMCYVGKLLSSTPDRAHVLNEFMKICDSIRRLQVRTNAETPDDAKVALNYGAEGIGLFRTEHMFYGKGSEEPLSKLRKMILSKSEAERRQALKELFPFVKRDVKATMQVMNGLPVTFRLLDPPLHEFVPEKAEVRNFAKN
jgi:pyruvate,orthophosphate dikinase